MHTVVFIVKCVCVHAQSASSSNVRAIAPTGNPSQDVPPFVHRRYVGRGSFVRSIHQPGPYMMGCPATDECVDSDVFRYAGSNKKAQKVAGPATS